MKTGIVLLLAVWLLAGAARADVIHYTDGRQLEGVIVERTDELLKVETGFGLIEVPLSKVARIEERLTLRQEYERQRATIADDDAPALFVLAQWAADQKLRKESRALMDEVLAADPEHAGANEALGRVQVDGHWMDPGEVDAYLAEVEAERRAQGLVLYEGEWIAEAEANRRKGLVLYEGEWLSRREADTRGALRDLATMAGWSTEAVAGEFVTVFGDLDDETTEYLVHDLDSAVRDFLLRSEATDAERERLVGRAIPVYVVRDDETSHAMLESEFLSRYPILGDPVAAFGHLNVFGMNWPAAFLVLVEGPHLEQMGDRNASRTGLLAHQFGRLFIDRFKGSRSAPGWIIVAAAAYYEGVVNYYATVSLTTEDDEAGGASGRWVAGWESHGEWRDQLADEAVHAGLPQLRHVLHDPIAAFDSRGVGMVWSFLRFLLEKHRTELFDYLRTFDSDPFAVATDLAAEHDRAWAVSFANTVDELAAEWRDWALTQPPRFPNNELKR